MRGNEHGWTSLGVAGPIAAGIVLLGAFVLWERRTPEPMVPLRFFRNRAFSAANVTSLLMSFGMFGSIFLLAQFFQVVQGYSPLEAGIRTLPWTAMPIFVAPSPACSATASAPVAAGGRSSSPPSPACSATASAPARCWSRAWR